MTSTDECERPRRYLSRGQQAKRYGRHVRTIKRWSEDPKMGMPPEYIFNDPDDPMRREDELEQWERSRVANCTDDTA